MGEFKIKTTTFDVALRHMKNGGLALAWFGEGRDSAALCRFDRKKNALQRVAIRGSESRLRDVFTPYAYVVGAPWILFQTDAFAPDPEETATDEAIRASFEQYVEPGFAEDLAATLKAAAPEETEAER